MSPLQHSFKTWVHDHKPVASVRVHVLLAAVMWTGVGSFLVTRGIGFLDKPVHASVFWTLLVAFCAGIVKGRFVLDRSARKIVTRIGQRGGEKCLGGFLSLKSWGLVLVMILLGRTLRASPVSILFVAALYVAVGSGLVFSSRLFWIDWAARASKPPVLPQE